MLQRYLPYTALTRSKKLAVLVGSRKAIAIDIKINKVQHRYTALAESLARPSLVKLSEGNPDITDQENG